MKIKTHSKVHATELTTYFSIKRAFKLFIINGNSLNLYHKTLSGYEIKCGEVYLPDLNIYLHGKLVAWVDEDLVIYSYLLANSESNLFKECPLTKETYESWKRLLNRAKQELSRR